MDKRIKINWIHIGAENLVKKAMTELTFSAASFSFSAFSFSALCFSFSSLSLSIFFTKSKHIQSQQSDTTYQVKKHYQNPHIASKNHHRFPVLLSEVVAHTGNIKRGNKQNEDPQRSLLGTSEMRSLSDYPEIEETRNEEPKIEPKKK